MSIILINNEKKFNVFPLQSAPFLSTTTNDMAY